MENDKFYTKPEIAKYCVDVLSELVDVAGFETIIEPSCGNGSFLTILPKRTIGLDLYPEEDAGIKQDFYEYSIPKGKHLLVGNPPFGTGGKEAVRFFNHASSFADTIAFILPRTFKRVSVQNRLSMDFVLKYQEDIPIGSFYPESMKAKCVFQIWERTVTKRKKVVLPAEHKDFKFTKDLKKANIAIKSYGGTGDCGAIEYNFEKLNPKAYHFIICDTEIVERFKDLEYYPLSSLSVRQDSLGKKELIWLYSQKYD